MTLLLPLMFLGIPAAGFWTGFALWHRHRRGHPGPPRVAVLAYVVSYDGGSRPLRIVFDCPLPDGRWNRVDRRVAFSPGPIIDGKVVPGTPFTVHVGPQDPQNVTLDASGTSRAVPILLGVGGTLFTLATVLVAVVIALSL